MNETRPIIAISLHSGTEAIFYPWGTGYGIPPDYNQIINAVYYAQLASGLGAMQSCSIYEVAGAWDDDAYAYYGIIPFTPEIFYDPEWPETGVTEDSLGNTVYYVRGLKWYFNPKPDHILETNQRVLNLFVGVAQYAMKLIADNTPPVIDTYKVTSINGTLYLVVKAHDYESGIHYIKAIVNGKTYYLIYNRILDAWTLKLHGEPNTLTIIVYNRAGLSTQQ